MVRMLDYQPWGPIFKTSHDRKYMFNRKFMFWAFVLRIYSAQSEMSSWVPASAEVLHVWQGIRIWAGSLHWSAVVSDCTSTHVANYTRCERHKHGYRICSSTHTTPWVIPRARDMQCTSPLWEICNYAMPTNSINMLHMLFVCGVPCISS